MKSWQKGRNYRRVKDESGHVVRYIITIDGADIEVTEDVFLAYSQAERRERYLEERDQERGLLHLSALAQDRESAVPDETTILPGSFEEGRPGPDRPTILALPLPAGAGARDGDIPAGRQLQGAAHPGGDEKIFEEILENCL